jgi:hypothetical protein
MMDKFVQHLKIYLGSKDEIFTLILICLSADFKFNFRVYCKSIVSSKWEWELGKALYVKIESNNFEH